ncbi:MAG: hypothetical protein ABWZ15_13870 [Acidimicrobiia bacterium]
MDDPVIEALRSVLQFRRVEFDLVARRLRKGVAVGDRRSIARL